MLIRKDSRNLNPRARQNVIFEFGFFVAKLGSSRTFVLRKPGVEIPSDYDGVLYIPMNNDGVWKQQLAIELRSAGLEVNMNNLRIP